jgi:hypothetical protein
MEQFSPAAYTADTHSPAPQVATQEALRDVGPVLMDRVGEGRHMHTAQRRARFVGRFIYWSCKHGSTKHAAWVCATEGVFW